MIVTSSFSVRKAIRPVFTWRRILYMTGAILDEYDRVLREAGAERVDVLIFAAGRNYIPQK